MQGKVAGMKEGKKETNGIELTNILHTSDLLTYLYPFSDMTVLMLCFYVTPVFFCSNAFFCRLYLC